MKNPKDILDVVIQGSLVKTERSPISTLILSIFSGIFISFGAIYFIMATSQSSDIVYTILGSLVFCLGLVLIILTGSELFTGNTMMVTGLFEGKLCPKKMLKQWVICFMGNFVGALVIVFLMYLTEHHLGDFGNRAVVISNQKLSLPFLTLFSRAILCNILVCLAVWISLGAETVSGKILSILFPISAFVAMGYEHSIANMFFVPMGNLIQGQFLSQFPQFLISNLLPVTLGNIVGGSFFVGTLFWVAWRKA